MRATVHEAIAKAVVAHGGDADDLRELLAVWARVARRSGERADLIRAQAQTAARRFEALTGDVLR
jgi:hypothetical protein